MTCLNVPSVVLFSVLVILFCSLVFVTEGFFFVHIGTILFFVNITTLFLCLLRMCNNDLLLFNLFHILVFKALSPLYICIFISRLH